jgi:hypothetical protein
VPLGTPDNGAEVETMAKQLGTSPARRGAFLRNLERQAWLTVKNDFAYPTIDALRWQNPEMDERKALRLLKSLR